MRLLVLDLAVAASAPGLAEIDPVALLEASIAQRETEVEALASIARLEPSALMALGQVSAWLLLLAIGERARGPLGERTWECGYCPV